MFTTPGVRLLLFPIVKLMRSYEKLIVEAAGVVLMICQLKCYLAVNWVYKQICVFFPNKTYKWREKHIIKKKNQNLKSERYV